ncbi:hypothetical protein G6F68_016778 [Rhizopus microsporus]|nr:hypothetical protein G6F68_016778 [Rhizopus microsporus]
MPGGHHEVGALDLRRGHVHRIIPTAALDAPGHHVAATAAHQPIAHRRLPVRLHGGFDSNNGPARGAGPFGRCGARRQPQVFSGAVHAHPILCSHAPRIAAGQRPAPPPRQPRGPPITGRITPLM